MHRKDTATLEKAFCENWVQIFGAPSVVAVDLENGLEKSLARISDWTGTRIRSAAGQAHHQAGYTERQGAIWKAIFSRVSEEFSVCQGDFHLAVGAVSSGKNQLTRTSGFSPCQHVFGSMPGLPEDLLEGPHAGHPETTDIIDDKHAREVALCAAARAAYFHVDPDRRAGPARACWPGTRGEPLTRVRRARLLLSQDQEQQTRLLDRSWDRHRKGRGELLGHSRWPLSPTCSESS